MSVVDLKRIKKRSNKRAPRDLVPIDQTSGAGRYFTRMAREIQADLGGKRDLTRIENELIAAFCAIATRVQVLNHQILIGEASEISLAGFSQLASTLLRIGSKLGLHARPKAPPNMDEFLRQRGHLRSHDVADEEHLCPSATDDAEVEQ